MSDLLLDFHLGDDVRSLMIGAWRRKRCFVFGSLWKRSAIGFEDVDRIGCDIDYVVEVFLRLVDSEETFRRTC